ncbi:hypothetical protein NKH77_06860 [Streptomyces sp. M19]
MVQRADWARDPSHQSRWRPPTSAGHRALGAPGSRSAPDTGAEHRDDRSRTGRTRPSAANTALATALKEAGCSYASLALRVNELGRRQGLETNYDKASVTRWLQGGQPRGTTPDLIAAVLSQRLGRELSPAELGFVADRQRPVAARALAYREDVGETLHTLAELGSTDISRRSLLGAVPFVAGALVNPSASGCCGWSRARTRRCSPRCPRAAGSSRCTRRSACSTRWTTASAAARCAPASCSTCPPRSSRCSSGAVPGARAAAPVHRRRQARRDGGLEQLRQRGVRAGPALHDAGPAAVRRGRRPGARRPDPRRSSHLSTSLGQPEAGVELARVGWPPPGTPAARSA